MFLTTSLRCSPTSPVLSLAFIGDSKKSNAFIHIFPFVYVIAIDQYASLSLVDRRQECRLLSCYTGGRTTYRDRLMRCKTRAMSHTYPGLKGGNVILCPLPIVAYDQNGCQVSDHLCPRSFNIHFAQTTHFAKRLS